MKLVFLGDIFGSPGRAVAKKFIPEIRSQYSPDFIIANGENAAAGFGLTKTVVKELFDMGLDAITGGNHIWDKKEILEILPLETKILRPYNYPSYPEHGMETPGKGFTSISKNGKRLGIINLLGRVFMDPVDDPFILGLEAADKLKKDGVNAIFVDFHAEATSEKNALGIFLDGHVSALVGTHTHVQTADERILPQGTAYITDVGLTGPASSVIGVESEAAIFRFLTARPYRFEPAKGECKLNAVYIEIDESTGKATDIKRILLSE